MRKPHSERIQNHKYFNLIVERKKERKKSLTKRVKSWTSVPAWGIQSYGQGSKCGGQGAICSYPAAPPCHVMAVSSKTRVVRVLWVRVDVPCRSAACICWGVAVGCVRVRPMAPRSDPTKCFLLLIMPKRRDCAKFMSASNIDLNKR